MTKVIASWTEVGNRPRSIAAFSGALIVVGMLAGWLIPATPIYRWTLIAATLVAGAGIARRAFLDLRQKVVGIELLVTIAVTGALIIGEVWEAAAVTFLFVLGGALEAATMSRTRRALGDLIDLAPATAVVLRNGDQIEVDPNEVAVGELVLVKPGARTPVDGEVVSGVAAMDEASITGESMPAEKTAGDLVFAGTVVVDGSLKVRTTGVGADTTLARIIHRVEEAQEAKAPAQRFMDRFARWYTPAVVVLAAVAFIITGRIELALTLLVIGCPGALVISIPVSVVAGIGRSARSGILVKGGQHLETAGRIDTIAFDKTGTLTRGEPRMTDVVVLSSDLESDDIVAAAAATESGSEHPLARPIIEGARRRGLPVPASVPGFVQHAGGGVEAVVDGVNVVVGTARLMNQLDIEVTSAAAEATKRLTEAGRTAVLVALDGDVVGVLGLADEVRPDAAAAIADLRDSGVYRFVMLTGDDHRVARAVGDAVGIDDIRAGLLPEEKMTAIRDLQADGAVVAMVGDGVNDAPALATADIGIAMGAAGTDVAIETADVALMSNRLSAVADAIKMSRRTANNLRQNVVVALGTVAILLTGVLLGEVHMAGGMLVHQASVLIVIANATRLLRTRLSSPSAQDAYGGVDQAVEESEWRHVDVSP